MNQDDDPVQVDTDLLRSELNFTIPLLISHPKCYWLWNHRVFILDAAPALLPTAPARAIWEDELALASKMLTKDRRNFHAWGYRRHVVAKLESPELGGTSLAEAEFAYTTKKIEADLSNFSAWHSRSRWIGRVLREREAQDAERRAFLNKGE